MDALKQLLVSPSFSEAMPSEDESEVEHLTELCLAHGPKPTTDEVDIQDTETDEVDEYTLKDVVQTSYTSLDADVYIYDTDVESPSGIDADDESDSEVDDSEDSDDDMIKYTSPGESVPVAPITRSGKTDFFITVRTKRRREDVEDGDVSPPTKRPRYTTPAVSVDPDFGELMKLLAETKERHIVSSAASDIPRTPEAQIMSTHFMFARHD